MRANLLACEASSDAAGKDFNIGCGSRISVKELWHRIREITGSDVEARYAPTRAGHVRDSLASLALAQDLLGYEPIVDLETGLRWTVEHFAAPAVAPPPEVSGPGPPYSHHSYRQPCASQSWEPGTSG